MALSRLLLGWALVTGWLLLWDIIARRGGELGRRAALLVVGEALLLTLFGALWFGSLGAGAWWLVFGLVAALREWPGGAETPAGPRMRTPRTPAALRLVRMLRTLAAGGILAWRLGAGSG
ncbi:MAG TPA: hypothetical protein VJQ44_01330 [Gemmatimonadales bacterium]|nr:hypothetical protein [Gemmatimonadales bacterium]